MIHFQFIEKGLEEEISNIRKSIDNVHGKPCNPRIAELEKELGDLKSVLSSEKNAIKQKEQQIIDRIERKVAKTKERKNLITGAKTYYFVVRN